MIAVSGIAAAAVVDAVLGADPDPAQRRVATGEATTSTASDTYAVPSAAFPLPALPRCGKRQLALRPDVFTSPAVVLYHRAGPACTQRAIPIRVRIVTGSGATGKGSVFGPEPDVFSGVFQPRGGRVAGFQYSPACGEQDPFIAVVRAGPYITRLRIPTGVCGQVFPEGP